MTPPTGEYYQPAPGDEWPQLPPDVAVEQLGEEDTLALGIGRVVLDNLHLEAVLRAVAGQLQHAGLIPDRTGRRVLGLSELLVLVRDGVRGLPLAPDARDVLESVLERVQEANASRHRVVHDRWFHDHEGRFGWAGWRQARQTVAINQQQLGRDFLDLWDTWEKQFDAGWRLTAVGDLIGAVLSGAASAADTADLLQAIRSPNAPSQWAPPPRWHQPDEF